MCKTKLLGYEPTPLEFFFQEQSYSSLHSGQSLVWDHVHGVIDYPCAAIADFCGVISDFCGVITIPEAIGGRAGCRCGTSRIGSLNIMFYDVWLAKHHKTLLNIVKHHETQVKHCETS